jgi:Inosine-uridine preferring nucleoside hydrolase
MASSAPCTIPAQGLAQGTDGSQTSVVRRPNVRPGAEDNLVMVTTRVQAQGHDDVRIRLLRPRNDSSGPPPRVVLDTDTYNEIDDQFALVHVLLSPERARLEAIYAAPFHNSRSSGPADGMRKSFEEIHRVLEVVGHVGPPVLEGATEWLTHSKSVSASPATEDLIERARSDEEGPLYVVAIGAPTNIISALLLAPEIVERVVVIWLGGNSLYWPTAREFNLEQDPKASQALFDCGVALVHVPCFNVADHLTTTRAEVDRYVEPAGKVGAFLAERYKQYVDDRAGASKVIWDLAATGWILGPSWTTSALTQSPVLTDDLTWSLDIRRHLMDEVTYVRRDAVFADLFGRLADHGAPAGPSPHLASPSPLPVPPQRTE